MSNEQMFFAIVGVVTVEIGVVLGFMFHQFSRIEIRLTVIEGDLRRFYQLIGEHTGKIEMLEKK